MSSDYDEDGDVWAAQWLALLPHGKKRPNLTLNLNLKFCCIVSFPFLPFYVLDQRRSHVIMLHYGKQLKRQAFL